MWTTCSCNPSKNICKQSEAYQFAKYLKYQSPSLFLLWDSKVLISCLCISLNSSLIHFFQRSPPGFGNAEFRQVWRNICLELKYHVFPACACACSPASPPDIKNLSVTFSKTRGYLSILHLSLVTKKSCQILTTTRNLCGLYYWLNFLDE